MESSGKRKILMLHGHGQCAYTMSRMFASTISECDQEIDFVFLDAPAALVPADFSNGYSSSASDASSTTNSKPTSTPSYPPTSRAWFKIQNLTIEWESMRESMVFLKEILKGNRFEASDDHSTRLAFAYFGQRQFQGAAIAELIAAMLEQPRLYPEFCDDGQAPHPPLRYVVAFSGFLLRGPCTEWGSTANQAVELDSTYFINTPILHVLGRTDVVVPRERSDLFMAHSNHKRIEEHVGGHFIPTAPRWREFFITFFKDPFAEIKSPSTSRKRQSFMPLPKANDVPVPPMAIGQTLPRPPVKLTRPTIQTIVTNFDIVFTAKETDSIGQTDLLTPTPVQRPSRPSVSFALSPSSSIISPVPSTPTWTPDSPFEASPSYQSMVGTFTPDSEVDSDSSTPPSGHSDGTLTPSDSSERSPDLPSEEPEIYPSFNVKSYSIAGRIYQGLLVAAGLGRNLLRAPIP
ncbi:Family of serine hydrolases 3 [Stygiomarasmius scandens]|uniref:Family of serine hydrolases 3 n=1 Tax=Marasmiellus scandens TaxID=2682957 RepID=A0ABR1IZ98_9AGAR